MLEQVKLLYYKHKQKMDYLIAGGWNTLFGYLNFVILYYFFEQYVHYTILVVISYILSITNAYICYKLFVFRTKGNWLKEYLRFYMVYGVAFAVNMALLVVMVERWKLGILLSQVVINTVIVMISYVGHKKVSFRQ